jgi:hypothetical protein
MAIRNRIKPTKAKSPTTPLIIARDNSTPDEVGYPYKNTEEMELTMPSTEKTAPSPPNVLLV